jgi:hypothetical protein
MALLNKFITEMEQNSQMSLSIFHQNMRVLMHKTDELICSFISKELYQYFIHITVHYLMEQKLVLINNKNYNNYNKLFTCKILTAVVTLVDHKSVDKVWTTRLANCNSPGILRGQYCDISKTGIRPSTNITTIFNHHKSNKHSVKLG